MKARVERERIPPGEDPEFHLKLGTGLAVRRRVHRPAAAAADTVPGPPATMGALERLSPPEW